MEPLFESFANSKRYKTSDLLEYCRMEFESFANSKRYKTCLAGKTWRTLFESFANSKRYKTPTRPTYDKRCLRALLIQKDTKRQYKEAIWK